MKLNLNKTIAGFVIGAVGAGLICYDIYIRLHSIDVNRISAPGIIGIICLLAGGILVIQSRNERRGGREPQVQTKPRITIPKSGYVEAVIIGITRNLRMEGAKEAYHIVCRYTDQENGAEETYTSEPLFVYPGKDVIGKKVKVFIDPSEPDHYHIDLESMSS